MDEAKLAEIEARANEATLGPWRAPDAHPHGVVIEADRGESAPGWGDGPTRRIVEGAGYLRIVDAAFIAHARTDVPALVAEVRRLRAENAMLRSATDAAVDGVRAMLPAALEIARREGAESMRERCVARCEELAEEESTLCRALEARGDQYGAAIRRDRAIARLQAATAIRALPLDAPVAGGEP